MAGLERHRTVIPTTTEKEELDDGVVDHERFTGTKKLGKICVQSLWALRV